MLDGMPDALLESGWDSVDGRFMSKRVGDTSHLVTQVRTELLNDPMALDILLKYYRIDFEKFNFDIPDWVRAACVANNSLPVCEK